MRASLLKNQMFILLAVLVIMLIIASLASPSFRTLSNMSNVLRQAVALGLVSIGQSYVMYSGGFLDLSVGSTMSLTSVIAAIAMGGIFGGNIFALTLILIVLGLSIGVINGLIIVKLKLHPFITTFATMSVIQGIVFMITTSPTGHVTQTFRQIANAHFGFIPVGMLILVFLILISYVILTYTRYGRSIYAVGGSKEIARLAGIKQNKILISTFAIAGVGAVLAGLFMTSRLGIGSPVVGLNYGFDSITAVVLGGTPLEGGRGNIIGTLIGVLILVLINNILNMIEVQAYWQYLIKASILLVAVGIQTRN